MNENDSKKTIIKAYVIGMVIGFIIGAAVTASILGRFIDITKF